MQIINRLFPYPILSEDVDDYVQNEFEANITDIKEEKDEVSFNVELKIKNSAIVEKILQNYIDIVIHVECSQTSFRQAFVFKMSDVVSVTLPTKEINGTVEVCCFLIATKNFVLDSRMGLNQDYIGSSFNLKKGNIVGYYNADKIIIEKDTDELLKPSSIFSVVKKTDAVLPFDVKLDDSKRIKIVLKEETYSKFLPLQNDDCLPIIHGVIVLPALIFTLERLKESNGNLEQYEDKSWFLAIVKQLELLNIDIYNGGLDSKTSVVIAQELLKLPVNKALDKIANLGD